MNIEINGVIGDDHIDTERLIFKVKQDDNLSDYVVVDSQSTMFGRVPKKDRHIFWFPNREVKKGDTVILYTKRGKPGFMDKDETRHVFYWNLDNGIWTSKNDSAILLHISNSGVKKVV